MDYYRHPRCAGVCDPRTHGAEADNPACGDIVRFSFQVTGGIIAQARTTGAGCAVSQAAASLLAERLDGKPLAGAAAVFEELEKLLAGQAADAALLGNLAALRMITANPARVRCARTALKAARTALPPAAECP